MLLHTPWGALQTEREALAVVWGCLHFHLYVYGHPFEIITDHKALVPLLNNPKSKPPLRIERWLLKLQQYQFNITYQPGHENPADYMSRHPISSSVVSGREQKLAEEYVNFIVGHAVPKAITLSQIQEATSSDSILPSIILAAQAGNWNTLQDSLDPCVRAYYNVRSELTTSQDARILLRGSRIAVPAALQDLAISLAHEKKCGFRLLMIKRRKRSKLAYHVKRQYPSPSLSLSTCLPYLRLNGRI